jgi:16S rRNA (adenine1518-N6/adenine1519-N6)-dimethyltransferase
MSAPIVVVDENDQPVGQTTKQEAWDKGLLHRIVRVVLLNSKGQMLLQHRTPIKDIFPDCWDTAAAGHVDAGEDYLTAAMREAEEELGMTGLVLKPLGNYRSDETWKGHRFNRFTCCYTTVSDVMPTKFEKDKIDGFEWFEVSEVKKLVREHPDKVTDGLRQVFERYY